MDNKSKETLKKASDAILEKAVALQVDIVPKGKIHKFLQERGILARQRVFLIHPIVLGCLIRISKRLVQIDPGIFEPGKLLSSIYGAADKHGDLIAEIVAIGLVRSREEPDISLVKFVKENFTSQELYTVLQIVRDQMDVQNFMNSIIFMRGLNVLENGEKRKDSNEVSQSIQAS